MKFKYTTKGDVDLMRRLRIAAKVLPKLIAGAVYRQCEYIMTRAKDEFVPVDNSPLKNSGVVFPPKIVRNDISCEMAFGGPAAPYAEAVHEHLSEHSPPSWVTAEKEGRPVQFSPAGHGPKYLERPMMEAVDTFAREVADDVNLEELLGAR